MSFLPLRVGILGGAKIARKVRRGILEGGNVIVAIASRSLDIARAWAAEAVASGDLPSAPLALGSYDELLALDSIDTVYMPLPCSTHLEWVIKAARAGNNIVVEKPVARNASELKQMLDACADAGVFLCDGTMFHFHPRLDYFLSATESVGSIRSVSSAFSFCGDESFFRENIRCKRALEPLGCLGDLGQYAIRIGLEVFKWQLPHSVSATASFNDERVPLHVAATFRYADGRVLCIECSFTGAFRQRVEVEGTTGCVRMDDFVIPRAPGVASFVVESNPDLDARHERVVGSERVVRVFTDEPSFAMFTSPDHARFLAPGHECVLATQPAAAAKEGYGTAPVSQEGLMWAALKAPRTTTPRPHPAAPCARAQWARRALLTQACLDAAMESAEKEGATCLVQTVTF